MPQYPTIRQPSRGPAVAALQRLLHLQEDGIFGPLTCEAVKQYQTAHRLTPDGICGPKTWKMLLSEECKVRKSELTIAEDGNTLLADVDPSTVRPSTRRRITEIIVHCTATADGKDFTVKEIRQWHTMPVSKGGRGWSDIGYHYVIYRDGRILSGRDPNISGAHCLDHNTQSLGIAYVGGLDAQGKIPKDTRTDAQRKSMLALLRRLLAMHPGAKVYGHCELASKACPSFNPDTLRDELRGMGFNC